jgi:tetratricopeptide (TPR) repeat protein
MSSVSYSDPNEQQLDEGLYAIGYNLLHEEKWAQAASILRLLLIRDPTNPRSWLALGACHEGISDFDVAVSLYEKALVACDDDSSLVSAIARAKAQGGLQ